MLLCLTDITSEQNEYGNAYVNEKKKWYFEDVPEVLTAAPHIYGNNHRPFTGRRPTPTYEGFFGLGSASAGDGKLTTLATDLDKQIFLCTDSTVLEVLN